MEKLKQQTNRLLQRVCLLSYIRLVIIILFLLSYLFQLTGRDFWWPVLGAFTSDLFALLLLVQLGALGGTYLIKKKRWTGFAIYSFFHLIHFLLINFGVYELRIQNLVITFLIMALFIILFITALKRIS